jgi:hypothetical protein
MPDREKVIKGLQIERECVSRDCDRDCGKCDLVQDRDWLLSVYDDALALLKEQEIMSPDEFKEKIWGMFSSIWDCEIDHPVFQDTVSELMDAVVALYRTAVKWG